MNRTFFPVHVPHDFCGRKIGKVHNTERSPIFILNYGIERLHIPECLNFEDFRKLAYRLDTQADKLIFMDIETTGLTSTPLFMIGTLRFAGHKIMIRQLLARDIEEEAGVLHYYAKCLRNYEVIVTFNGTTFDIPYIFKRSNRHDVEPHLIEKHYDVLKHARKRWKGLLPDCRLQTLERYVCKRERMDDTPGHLIPRVYNEFIETGDWSLLDGILYHNALDLVTTAELLTVLME